mmetsp:Transcript_31012/g.95963  ORF Transcript_31012/g.95963 Transcript_31012/m.95963 type:complete len:293 (+) Transcript_31012:678-1556(+)
MRCGSATSLNGTGASTHCGSAPLARMCMIFSALISLKSGKCVRTTASWRSTRSCAVGSPFLAARATSIGSIKSRHWRTRGHLINGNTRISGFSRECSLPRTSSGKTSSSRMVCRERSRIASSRRANISPVCREPLAPASGSTSKSARVHALGSAAGVAARNARHSRDTAPSDAWRTSVATLASRRKNATWLAHGSRRSTVWRYERTILRSSGGRSRPESIARESIHTSRSARVNPRESSACASPIRANRPARTLGRARTSARAGYRRARGRRPEFALATRGTQEERRGLIVQ